MLVSAHAGAELLGQVASGQRPRTEYLLLNQRYGVDLLDWGRAGVAGGGRSPVRSVRHVRAALPELSRYDAILSDGEHVGIPLALAMQAGRSSKRHVMIGHQLVTRAKKPFFTVLRAQRRIDRIVVHSHGHLEAAHRALGIPRSKLALIPYGVDTEFWRPLATTQESLIVCAGRDHRDFETLARACARLPCRVFVTIASLYSSAARARLPKRWPDNFDNGVLSYPSLRELYARASVIVVPMMPVDYAAGVTSLLEAMAMGKAVVVSATAGLAGIVRDGETGVTVKPGNAGHLRDCVAELLARPEERSRLGKNAREAVLEGYSLELFAEQLASELDAVKDRVAAAPLGFAS